MRARASFVVDQLDGKPVLRNCLAEPPFAVRVCDGRVLMAASAAAPVGGDELEVDAEVRPGARADIGSVASMLIQPGPGGEQSSLRSKIRVGRAAHLDWRPEPAISIAGSNHVTYNQIDLASGATCRVVEEVCLGRIGEPSGELLVGLRVVRAGKTLLNHIERFGPTAPGFGSIISVGSARHVLSAVLVGIEAGPSRVEVTPEFSAAWLPIADDAAVAFAVGKSRSVVSRGMAHIAPELVSGV